MIKTFISTIQVDKYFKDSEFDIQTKFHTICMNIFNQQNYIRVCITLSSSYNFKDPKYVK